MKTYCIKFKYEGINHGEYGIIPRIVRANTAREAIAKLIEGEKEDDCKVTEIHAVYQLMKEPKGGWLANVQKEKDK